MEFTRKKVIIAFSIAAATLAGGGYALHRYTPEAAEKAAVTVIVPPAEGAAKPTGDLKELPAAPQPAAPAEPVREPTPLEKLQSAIDEGKPDAVQALIAEKSVDLKSADARTLVHAAIARADVNMLKALLEAGAQKDAQDEDGYTPLMQAAQLKNPEEAHAITRVLLDAKVNPSVKLKSGHNAFVIAVSERNSAAAVEILKTGASADEVFYNEHGFTPVMFAAKNGDAALLLAMLGTNPDLDIKNNDGETALMLAVREGNAMTSMMLVRAGANLTIRNEKGENVAEIAATVDNREIKALFQMIAQDEAILNLQPEQQAKPPRNTPRRR